ncbi:13710_t:CDS:2, partial [Gigaspora rosea]
EAYNSGATQRIIRIVEIPVDPMDPPKFKQKNLVIPLCISKWKNAKGYTIPLDKRLATDGRGLQE